MLALLNVKICCQADQSGDMNSLLQESLNSPIFTLDRDFKGETEQFIQDVYNDSDQGEAVLDIEEEKSPSGTSDTSSNIFNKFKFTKRFFYWTKILYNHQCHSLYVHLFCLNKNNW